MGTDPTRRDFVTAVSSVSLVGMAGCTSTPGSPSPSKAARNDSLCTEAVSPPPADTDDDDRVIVREYPDFPDEITEKSAESYAKSFEEAYQLNRLANQSSARDYKVIRVYPVRSNEVENGFIVFFTMDLSWKTDSGGMTVIADYTATVTYFVSQGTVIRYEGSTKTDPRQEGVGEVVVCRERR